MNPKTITRLFAVSLALATQCASADQRPILYSSPGASPAVLQAAQKISDTATPKVDYAALTRQGDVFVRIAPRGRTLTNTNALSAGAFLSGKPYAFVTTPESVYGKSLLDIYLDIGYEAEDVIHWQRDQDMVAIVFRFPDVVRMSDVGNGALPADWNAQVYAPTWDNMFALFDRLAGQATIDVAKASSSFAPSGLVFASTAERDFVTGFPAAARAGVKAASYDKLSVDGGDPWRYRQLMEQKLSVFEHFCGDGHTRNELVDRDCTTRNSGILEFVGPNQKLPELKDVAVVRLGMLGIGDSYAPASRWVAASGGTVPEGAVKAGAEAAPGRQPLYVCRASYQGGLHPGKLRSDFKGCNLGWGGKEVVVPDYEVLTE
ncbi:DM9 repeat-containing protein [Methylomagnum ishizawai]|uniref:DM9 repeat-containing protein n=1 Tax=Methylomagnum ishizawai TaxID=1760988 RepID=UPI001C33CC4A|nr:DM9 repeat-containing protein [Methylomagnum ishizawai]BBL76446.1 hypothetical protein MishRS11D_35440 [Methylomagnum ishizawai]